MPRKNGIEVIEEIRRSRSDLAILAFSAAAPPSEAIAAMVAGADHFIEYDGGVSIDHALDLAIDRRRLAQLIERSEAEVDAARRKLGTLSGSASTSMPGFRPPASPDLVKPFAEAASQYLAACAKLLDGDPRGLAERLGISYFALRRLLKRYGVPFPGRSRSVPSRKR
jgi:DNA-binding NtrC family response regulator